eukprot:Sspe_Gene.22851::Locus_8767_Transcript_1_1_Confidence_1.000_Length_2439::g.22851::m.22851
MPIGRGAARVAIQRRWHSYDFFPSDVAARPPNRELRRMWHTSPKYFQAIPRYGYHPKWMPTIAPDGRDVEVDPFNRISKQGQYRNMVVNWEPWYNLGKLVTAMGAPPYHIIARDLHIAGVRLGDAKAAQLVNAAVVKLESALFLRSKRLIARRKDEVRLVLDEVWAHHTVGLKVAAGAITYYGLEGRYDRAQEVEREVRYLLDDPEETDLRAKRMVWEAMSLAAVTAMQYTQGQHWQGVMVRKGVRPSKDYWYQYLSHLTAQRNFTGVLEVARNMETRCIKETRHYHKILLACAEAGNPEAFLRFQLEMKQARLHRFASGHVWDLLLRAHSRSGNLSACIAAWERLRHARIASKSGGYLTYRRRYRPGEHALRDMFSAYAAAGDALGGYRWFRREAVLTESPHVSMVRCGNTPPNARSLLFRDMLTALVSQGHAPAAAELYDEIFKIHNRRYHVPLLHAPRVCPPIAGGVWRVASMALAETGRLHESHHALCLMYSAGAPAVHTANDYIPLLTAAVNRGDTTVLAACDALMEKRRIVATPEVYAALLSLHCARGDVAGALRCYSEMRSRGIVFGEQHASRVLSEMPPSHPLFPTVWCDLGSSPRTSAALAVASRLHLADDVPHLPGLDESLIAGVAHFEGFVPPPPTASSRPVFVVDGTAALHLAHLPQEGEPVVLYSVLLQLNQGRGAAPTEKDRKYCDEALEALRHEGRARFVPFTAEPHRQTTPLRVLAHAQQTGGTVFTNDVEFARACLAAGVAVRVPSSNSRAALRRYKPSPALLE